jgi:hypothetical protein
LGTGLGVCTAWIARALKENGRGEIVTYDDGRQYGNGRLQWIEHLQPPLDMLRGIDDHQEFLDRLFSAVDVTDYVRRVNSEIVLGNPEFRRSLGTDLDIVFSDFNHAPSTVMDILATFLPLMAESSSIFIDSASTMVASYLTLEMMIDQLNHGKVPRRFLQEPDPCWRARLIELASQRRFRLMHLCERKPRHQNSTTWIRIEPLDWFAADATHLH